MLIAPAPPDIFGAAPALATLRRHGRRSAVRRQRAKQLADLFDELGPDPPTLLDPWTTHDLAAHLVLREHEYLAAPGLVLRGAWGRFAERRRTALAREDFPWLVATIRPDRHQVSSASVGCGAWPTSSTTRMCAEPTVVVLEPTRPRWMRRSGASRDAVAKRRLGGTPTPRSLGGSGHEAASTYRCQARAPPSGRLGNLESQCLVRSDSSTVVHVIRSPQPSSE